MKNSPENSFQICFLDDLGYIFDFSAGNMESGPRKNSRERLYQNGEADLN